MSESTTAGFDPAKHITKLGPADYLEVKWRLVWFRAENEQGMLETENVALTDKMAVFKATVTADNGAEATGFGSETAADFRDYIEKAETKAIGRALAALGYGTQFATDFEDAPSGRLADSPVNRPNGQTKPDTRGNPATAAQIGLVKRMLTEAGLSSQEYLDSLYPDGPTKGEVTALINKINAGEIRGAEAPPAPDSFPDGRPSSPATTFWTRANELGLKTVKDVSAYLGRDVGTETDFGVLLTSINEQAKSLEFGTPY